MALNVATDTAERQASDVFSVFEYVRDIIRTPPSQSDAMTVFITSLAVEGTVIDQLLESHWIQDTMRTAVIEAKSESRKRQAEVLLTKMAECRECPIALLLFFLCAHQPGLLNVIEEGLLERVQDVLDTDWNILEDHLAKIPPCEEKAEADKTLKEFAEKRETRRPLTLLCVGKTGAGKSTLANALLGKKIAKTGRGGDCVTAGLERLELECPAAGVNQPFIFWDTPGLLSADKNASKAFAESAKEIKKSGKDVDLFLFSAPAQEGRDHPDNRRIIKTLTTEFGKNVWKVAVIAFTQANLVVDPDSEKTTAAYFHEQCISEMKMRYRKFLVQEAGLSPEEAEAVPCVPTGMAAQPCLPDGTDWKKELWITCLGRVREDVRGVLIECGITDQERFFNPVSGIDKVRLIMGMLGIGVGRRAQVRVQQAVAGAVGRAAGAAVGLLGGAAVGASMYAGMYGIHYLYQRYKQKKRVQLYETLVGDRDEPQT